MEIKFRVWSDNYKKMYDQGILQTEGESIMQFSTLQDYSNPKKDIFTGDILSIAGHQEIPDGNYPVIFAEGSFCVDTPESTPTLFDVLMATTDVYVAGNIYQDEDLLTHKR